MPSRPPSTTRGGGSRDRSPITISRRVVTFVRRGVASVRSSRVAADRSAVADSVFIRRDTALVRLLPSRVTPRNRVLAASVSRGGLRARRRCRCRRCHRRRPVSAICSPRGVHGGRDVGEAAGGVARQRVLVKIRASSIVPIQLSPIGDDAPRTGPAIPLREDRRVGRERNVYIRDSWAGRDSSRPRASYRAPIRQRQFFDAPCIASNFVLSADQRHRVVTRQESYALSTRVSRR